MLESKKNVTFTYLQVGALALLSLLFVGRELNMTKNSGATIEPVPSHVNRPPPLRGLPDVIIYRRSKKTGSSSMVNALLGATAPLGYVPLLYPGVVMQDVVRLESMKPEPRPLLVVAQHNRVTREDTAGRRAIIVDTVVNGYRQITSYCRSSQNASDCGDSMVSCMEDMETRSGNVYRWVGREEEDADTYIDMPLSSAHPGLSTTVFRNVFGDVTLDLKRYNVAGSACKDDPKLRSVFKKYYAPLERQADVLMRRMLTVAGYPATVEGSPSVTPEQLLDAAEKIEREKYRFGSQEGANLVSTEHKGSNFGSKALRWVVSNTGEIELTHDPKIQSGG